MENNVVRVWFQFHTGSIKSNRRAFLIQSDTGVFQFHTGSIKRRLWICPQRQPIDGFNSILVRLKVNIIPHYSDIVSFNSILVRLKETWRR